MYGVCQWRKGKELQKHRNAFIRGRDNLKGVSKMHGMEEHGGSVGVFERKITVK